MNFKETALLLIDEQLFTSVELDGKTDYAQVSAISNPYAHALAISPNRLVWAIIDQLRAQTEAPVDVSILTKLKDLK